jgi:hypothetical protein
MYSVTGLQGRSSVQLNLTLKLLTFLMTIYIHAIIMYSLRCYMCIVTASVV